MYIFFIMKIKINFSYIIILFYIKIANIIFCPNFLIVFILKIKKCIDYSKLFNGKYCKF